MVSDKIGSCDHTPHVGPWDLLSRLLELVLGQEEQKSSSSARDSKRARASGEHFHRRSLFETSGKRTTYLIMQGYD